jgi:exodeoxyribonuclease VII small subunit
MSPKKKSDTMNFSSSFAELEKIVEKFEHGNVDVEEGLKDFEHALTLARALKERLASVESKVTEIKKKFKDVVEDAEAEQGSLV